MARFLTSPATSLLPRSLGTVLTGVAMLVAVATPYGHVTPNSMEAIIGVRPLYHMGQWQKGCVVSTWRNVKYCVTGAHVL